MSEDPFILFVSKVSLLLNLLGRKWWYAELMTFLVSLAMGTMYCITIFQFIPESLGELNHEIHAWSKNWLTLIRPLS